MKQFEDTNRVQVIENKRYFLLGNEDMKKTDGGRLYGEEPKMDVIESSETSKDDEVVEDVRGPNGVECGTLWSGHHNSTPFGVFFKLKVTVLCI